MICWKDSGLSWSWDQAFSPRPGLLSMANRGRNSNGSQAAVLLFLFLLFFFMLFVLLIIIMPYKYADILQEESFYEFLCDVYKP